jgi:ribonuclease E
MPDIETDYDPQDSAEAFDETHRSDEDGVSADALEDAPDLDDDVLDVTSAVGDSDEDEGLVTADDMSAEDLDDLDTEDDEEDDEEEDEDADLDDDLEDEPEDDDLEDEDDDLEDDDLDDEDLDDDEEETEETPESKAADSDRLDEGLEETFPASDPVSAKHIT